MVLPLEPCMHSSPMNAISPVHIILLDLIILIIFGEKCASYDGSHYEIYLASYCYSN
jgi:hypothetical protein